MTPCGTTISGARTCVPTRALLTTTPRLEVARPWLSRSLSGQAGPISTPASTVPVPFGEPRITAAILGSVRTDVEGIGSGHGPHQSRRMGRESSTRCPSRAFNAGWSFTAQRATSRSSRVRRRVSTIVSAADPSHRINASRIGARVASAERPSSASSCRLRSVNCARDAACAAWHARLGEPGCLASSTNASTHSMCSLETDGVVNSAAAPRRSDFAGRWSTAHPNSITSCPSHAAAPTPGPTCSARVVSATSTSAHIRWVNRVWSDPSPTQSPRNSLKQSRHV